MKVTKQKLSIAHINTHDKAGGAAKVAWRLMEAQRAEGHDANMLVGAKMSNSPYSYSFPLEIEQSIQAHCQQNGQLFYEYQGSHKLINHPLVRNADVLHLHNLHGGYFNPFSISALSHLKPVVWTLHDMQSFTGHCAHSFDCDKWMVTCGECPYLDTEPALPVDTTTPLFQDKKLAYEHSYLWVVTPSQWLKNKVERSILRNQPVELIYNGIDTNIFRPYNKKEARKKFHIPEDVLVIGAVGHGGTLENQWKGGKYTQAALEIVMARFPDCIFLNIGANSETRDPRILNVPHISSESELAQAYSTLDIFLYTSIADNCPLVVLEALSCGVPIVTFDTGGIPELVRDGVDGQVSQYKNEREIVKSLEKLATDAGLRAAYSQNAREIAMAKFDHKIVFEQYGRLYERCVKEHKIRSKEIKYFPISKMPKIIVTKSFIEAENAKAVSQNQDLPSLDTRNREAELKIQMRDFSGAKPILLNVIERCPYNLNALNNLAITEIAEKNWESAAGILKKNLELDAANETTLKNLKYLENRLILHKSVLAAKNLINQKGFSEAREILEKVVEIDNEHIDALNNLALIGILEKNFESASLLLEKVLSLDSTNEIANKQLGYIRQYKADNPSAKIDVSIVVSTKDRAKLLNEMLTSLEKAMCGVNYEIIVIEGNSSDNTLEILHEHGIKQVYNEAVFLGAGRHSWPQLYNFGFSKARGLWGMFASDDITFNDECISKAVALLSKQNSDVAGGIFFYKNIIAEPGWDKFGIDYTYGQKLLMNYGLLRLKDFIDVNGLDEEYKFYCADGDLCLKLYEKGKKLLPLSQCLVIHNNVLDNQKKTNLNDSKHDIELYLRKWKHFVSTNKTPEPRRLFLETSLMNPFDTKSTFVSTEPPQTTHVKKLKPNINTLDQLRMAGVWTDGQPLRLHLGCGERRLSGYINIDYPPIEHTVQTKSASDVFADITALQFPDQTVDEIRLHHVFEHFDRPTALALLCRWNLWLKAGGSILVETPDFEASIALIDSPLYSYKEKEGILRHIFGSHEAEWAVHKDGWYKNKFQHVLSEFGFCGIQFEFTEWQMTRNITVRAKKQRIINLPELQLVAKDLLRNCMIDRSASEEKLWQVLCHKFDELLMKTDCGKSPKVSIFIPVYNSEKYLAETLESLLAQTFHDFEIIIADDGSTDKSLEIARVYENRDKRIRALPLQHNGEVIARNEAIKHTNPTSKYLLNHDSDDISLPAKLKRLVEFLETHPEIAIVGCFAEYFDDENNCKGQPPIEWQSERIRETFGKVNSMINSAALVRREVFQKIGGYREEFRSVDDYDFFARALIAGFELANIPEVLHRIRLHPTSVGITRAKTQQILAEKIRENYKQQNGERQRTVQFDKPVGNNFDTKITAQQSRKSLAILHTVEFYHPHMGGAETVVQQTSERLARRGHRVTVATTRLDDRAFHELNGVQIREFSLQGSLGNGIFGGDVDLYKKFLWNNPADVMMNYAAQQWATDLAFEALSMRKNKVNIIAPCGYSALSNGRTLRWPQFADYFNRIIPFVLPQYDAAIYHSSLYQDYEYAQNHGFTNGLVISNGVDENEFSQPPKVNFREKYNIKTLFLGLCVANYYTGKGHDRVIECIRQMNRKDFTMVFIGKEGDQLAGLKAQVDNLNIRFCVDISREDTLAAYREADMFLFGSYIEASPLVIIEAKASKTPFVSTDCGNVREWKGGIVCAPEEMAINANRILDDENLRKQFAEEGWFEWKEKLTWESVVDKYEDLYLRLSSEKQKGSSTSVQTHHLQSCANSNQLQDNGSKIMMLDGLADLFQKAEDAFLKGAYDEAINNYKKITEIDSTSFSFEAYESLAIAYTKVNQIDNAISTLEKSICLCDSDPSVYNNLGVLYFKKSMYLDAKIYFEIALLLNPDYKEARQNLGKVEESIKNASHTKKTNLTLGLIFSKDRAMQLDATLRSFYMHCSDAHLLDLKVIYKTSNTVHEKQYEDLKKHYVNVLFIKEDGFKEQVLSVIRKYTYVLFLVDDNIFLRNFSISDLTNNLNENKNAIGFSLRLGANTVYCYALHSSQTLPNFTMVTSDILKYDWTSAERDFGYPLEVSSSLYRVKEIYPLLVQIHFRNPNTLEDQLAANKHIYVKTRPILLCGKLSLTFCAPLNMVQNVCDNRAGSEDCYTSNTLSKKFGEGYRINIENYTNFTPNACHQEVPLDFIRSKMNPIVSVIIPCYNQANYLPEAVASVVNQTFQDWECIIVNDGSSDNTPQIANSLIMKYSEKHIRLINQENKGLAEARNAGIKASKGKYILPLDADDLIHPEMLQKTVSLLKTHPEIAIAYTDGKHFGGATRIVCAGEYDFKRLCLQNYLNYCSLYRRETWESAGGYNPNMVWGYEDWDFWIACGEKGYCGKWISEPLFMYRVKETSMYTKALEHHSELMARIIINHPNLYDKETRDNANKIVNLYLKKAVLERTSIVNEDVLGNMENNDGISQYSTHNRDGINSKVLLQKQSDLSHSEGISHHFPKQIHFLMNDKCNAKCIMCGGAYYNSTSGKTITLEKFKIMAANLKLEHTQGIVLAGAGDPLLNKDLISIIQYVRREYPHIKVSITTNGIALSNNVSRQLLENNIASINISINSATRMTYKRIMQVDCFDKICKNTKTLVQMRNLMGKNIQIQFSCAINKLNIEELPLLVELGENIGIDSINIMYCRFYPERIRHVNVDKQENRLNNSDSLFYYQELSDCMVEQAKTIAQKNNIRFSHEPLFKENALPRPCAWPYTETMVGFDGEIYPCGGAEVHFKENVEQGIYNFGNALTNPIDSFWNNDHYRALRIASKQGETCLIPECRYCANIVVPNDIKFHIMQWDNNNRETLPKKKHKISTINTSNVELPLVSVIVPTYNRPDTLKTTLDSIAVQTYKNIETIVVNDAGEDVSGVIDTFRNRLSIKYLVHPINKGLAASRNTGINAARGKYIAYLDDDDVYYHDHIETLAGFLENNDYKVAYTDAYRAYQEKENGEYVTKKREVSYSYDFEYDYILVNNFVPVLCIMHEKDCLFETGFFDESLRALEDMDCWIRMSRKYKFAHIKRVTCEFAWREDGSSITSGQRPEFLKAFHVIYNKYREYALNKPHVLKAQEELLRGLKFEIEAGKNTYKYNEIFCEKRQTCTIIIPVFNKVEFTRKCIESIIRNTPQDQFEIIIIDNASTDATKDFLKSLVGNIRVITNEKNLGFAKACNQGAKVASDEYLLFLNNDTEPEKGWLEPLIDVLDKDPSVGAVGSKLLFPTGTIQHAGVTIVDSKKTKDPLLPLHIYANESAHLPDANQLFQYQALTAACLLIRKSAFNETGGFDEGYWNGYEDVDLCFKLQGKGWKLVYQPESVVIHHESKSGPDRFSRVSENIQRLHNKWIGKIKPDIIINEDGSTVVAENNKVRRYLLPHTNLAKTFDKRQIKTVSIIILTWNALDYTRKCVNSIQYHTSCPHEIVFVDNASGDGTVEYLRNLVKEHSNYKLIENKENRGFAAGNNQGVAAASGEYVMLLNNDVLVSDGWLESLVKSLESDEKIGMVGPITNSISGRQMVNSIPYTDDAGFHEFSQKIRKAYYGRLTPRYRIAGFAALMKKSLYEEVGGLGESFGTGNYEDDDLCLKIRDKGYAIMVDESVFIHHYRSQTFIENKIDYRSSLSVNESKFMGKWPDVDYKSLLELDKSLVDINADLVSQGQKAIESEKTDEALNVYSKVLRTNPIDEAALCGIGLAYQMGGKTDGAIDAYKKVIKKCIYFSRQPPSGGNSYLLDAYHNLALVYAGANQLDDAIFMLKKAVELSSSDASLLNNLGVLYFKKKMHTEAAQCFSDALSIDAQYGEAKKNLEKVLISYK